MGETNGTNILTNSICNNVDLVEMSMKEILIKCLDVSNIWDTVTGAKIAQQEADIKILKRTIKQLEEGTISKEEAAVILEAVRDD